MPQMFMEQTPEAAKEDVLKSLGDIDGIVLDLNYVLVAIYERPEKTASGIFLSDKTRKEDKWQGKAALIVKLGPGVDMDDGRIEFCGRKLAIGDWVAVQPADGWPVNINGKDCRIVPDYRIFLRIPRPDMVW